MNNQSVIYGIVGLIIGAGITGVIIGNQPKQPLPLPSHSMNSAAPASMSSSTGMSMENMVANLKGKSGDEFDRMFISDMILHHQGAIDMANQAKSSAKHDELKQMADDIISAQTKEIETMKQWQKDWGYTK